MRVLFYVRGFECGMHLTARAEEAGGNGFPEWRAAAEAGGLKEQLGYANAACARRFTT